MRQFKFFKATNALLSLVLIWLVACQPPLNPTRPTQSQVSPAEEVNLDELVGPLKQYQLNEDGSFTTLAETADDTGFQCLQVKNASVDTSVDHLIYGYLDQHQHYQQGSFRYNAPGSTGLC